MLIQTLTSNTFVLQIYISILNHIKTKKENITPYMYIQWLEHRKMLLSWGLLYNCFVGQYWSSCAATGYSENNNLLCIPTLRINIDIILKTPNINNIYILYIDRVHFKSDFENRLVVLICFLDHHHECTPPKEIPRIREAIKLAIDTDSWSVTPTLQQAVRPDVPEFIVVQLAHLMPKWQRNPWGSAFSNATNASLSGRTRTKYDM